MWPCPHPLARSRTISGRRCPRRGLHGLPSGRERDRSTSSPSAGCNWAGVGSADTRESDPECPNAGTVRSYRRSCDGPCNQRACREFGCCCLYREVMGVPADLFESSEVPSREWVLGQTIRFDPVDIHAKLPDPQMWPSELDDLPDGGGKYRLIARRDVFAIAERAAQEGSSRAAAQLHVACIAWGTSPGQTLVRALRPLHEAGAADKLARALDVARHDGPVSAYRALCSGGRCKVRYLAAGFFTKLLYFGGYDSKPLLGRPLIYDSRVVAALNKWTDGIWKADGPPEMYSRYLDLAADWGNEAGTDPDVIERALFGR